MNEKKQVFNTYKQQKANEEREEHRMKVCYLALSILVLFFMTRATTNREIISLHSRLFLIGEIVVFSRFILKIDRFAKNQGKPDSHTFYPIQGKVRETNYLVIISFSLTIGANVRKVVDLIFVSKCELSC